MFRLLGALLLVSMSLLAQTPSCTPPVASFTSATAGTSINNRIGSSPGCVLWVLSYFNTGFSAVSVQLESAPDNGSGAPGSWAAIPAAAVVTGTNPSTDTAGTMIVVKQYFPWIRVRLVSATGSGTVRYQLLGFNASVIARGGAPAVTVADYTGKVVLSYAQVPTSTNTQFTAIDGGTIAAELETGAGYYQRFTVVLP